jgi:hypothetical protein
MTGELVSTDTVSSFKVRTHSYGPELLHRAEFMAPVTLNERIPFYEFLLQRNRSGNLFCILDNRGRHENVFQLSDIQFVVKMCAGGGIKSMYGATVTLDLGYSTIVDLATANVASFKLAGELIATPDTEEAERFTLSKMKQVMDGG